MKPRLAQVFAVAAAALALAAAPVLGASMKQLAGVYNSQQMEIGAELDLSADGHFKYALAYGALDEEAQGTWAVSGNSVLLTSQAVTPPRFTLVGQEAGPANTLHIALDVPQGLSRQYFSALVHTKDGRDQELQFSEDGLDWDFTADNPPTALRIGFPVYEVASDPLKLEGHSGYDLHFSFAPNDLGKVAFDKTPLQITGGGLELQQHGQAIRLIKAKK